jgi:hypothetical protein
MWKTNGKTTTLQHFLDSLSPKTEKLSLEGTMDLSQDRLILELDSHYIIILTTVQITATHCHIRILKYALLTCFKSIMNAEMLVAIDSTV